MAKAERLVVDLRQELRDFVADLGPNLKIPGYVLNEVVNMVFDVLIYELEEIHEEPDLTRLANFYRDFIEPDPIFTQRFLECFFLLVKDIACQLRSHGVYSGSGFSYAPEKNLNNRSIVVKKFEVD